MNKQDFFTSWQEEINSIFNLKEAFNDEQNPQAKPSMYNIYLVNNEDIPVNFFVNLLEEEFRQEQKGLVNSFNKIRNEGFVCYGLYTKDIAENKIKEIYKKAKSKGYSIKCIMCKDHEYAIKKS